MKTQIIQNIKSVILILILVIGIGYVSADWANPPAGTVPPANNTATPVNVGSASQIKSGPLTLGGLGILGDFKFLPISGTPPTAGQVLMADDANLALGKIKWGEGGNGFSLIGPLKDPANGAQNQQVSFNVTSAGDVWVIAFAQGSVPNSVAGLITLYVDNVAKDDGTIRDASISGGADQSSMVLTARANLSAGSHTLKLTAASPASFSGSNSFPLVKFYVIPITGTATGGTGGGGSITVVPQGWWGRSKLCGTPSDLYSGCTGNGPAYLTNYDDATCPTGMVQVGIDIGASGHVAIECAILN